MARRRAGMDNIFTGETCEQATEKHNLRMDYAAVLQEQIRLQNAKKEQLKQQKLDEQRLEREEMDRMRGNNNNMKQHHPQLGNQGQQQPPPPSPDKTQPTSQPQRNNLSPVKSPPPSVHPPTTTHGSPATFVPQYESPMQSAFNNAPLYTAPMIPQMNSNPWRPPAATPELDAIQRLRQELEDARKLRTMAQKQVYQKPNFMLASSTPSVTSSAWKGNSVYSATNVSPRDQTIPKDVYRRQHSRPATPVADDIEQELGMDAGNNNQLESSSSFVAVTIPEKHAKEPRGGGMELQVESCFVPLAATAHYHAPLSHQIQQTHGGVGGKQLHPESHREHFLSGEACKTNRGIMHCSSLEDSIDDIDAILHAFLAKTRG